MIYFFHKKIKKHQYLIIAILSFIIVVILILFTLWSIYLFKQLEFVTSKRVLRHPAVFYSDILKFNPGMQFSSQLLIRRLEERGYVNSQTSVYKQGQYKKIDENHVYVFVRPFIFPGAFKVSGKYNFIFENGILKSIEKDSSQFVETFFLEPVLIGDSTKEGIENCPWIPLYKIPYMLKLAVLNSEDRRFYQHFGIDPKSLLRAVWINVKHQGVYQGGSTITQQLVKNAFLTQQKTFRRKLTEALLSFAMEIRYSKDSIFEMYLNQIYMGQNGTRSVYGMADASLAFFGKPVSELTLNESCILVGMIPAPNAFNPIISPKKAIARRNLVLDNLFRNGYITFEDCKKTKEEPITLAPKVFQSAGNYYLTWVRKLLQEEFDSPVFDTQGYRIFTAMDPGLQRAAESIMKIQPVEGALIAMDPNTGCVKAMVGGKDYAKSHFNRAVLARRHPGSVFKPIIYAAALEAKTVTLATIIIDSPLRIKDGNNVWEPQNYDNHFVGNVSVRDAIVFSRNIPAVRVFQTIGHQQVISLAKQLGIQSQLNSVPSLALGTSEVTPLEMTSAYSAFANNGNAVSPIFIKYVTNPQGDIIKSYTPQLTKVITPETASLITNVLQDVINRGTAENVKILGFLAPAAGKTGTSANFMDAWFIGYTPNILCGVWIGHDKPKSLGHAASSIAVPVWVKFMKAAYNYYPVMDFEENKNIIKSTIDPVSGLKARLGCPVKKEEFFLPDTVPNESCNLHAGGIKGLFNRLFGTKKNKI